MKSSLKIISFEEIYAKAFYQLNIEWLETFFYVEIFDKEDFEAVTSVLILMKSITEREPRIFPNPLVGSM